MQQRMGHTRTYIVEPFSLNIEPMEQLDRYMFTSSHNFFPANQRRLSFFIHILQLPLKTSVSLVLSSTSSVRPVQFRRVGGWRAPSRDGVSVSAQTPTPTALTPSHDVFVTASESMSQGKVTGFGSQTRLAPPRKMVNFVSLIGFSVIGYQYQSGMFFAA